MAGHWPRQLGYAAPQAGTCDDASVAVAPVPDDRADGVQHCALLLPLHIQLQLPRPQLQRHQRVPLRGRSIKLLTLHILLQLRLVGRNAGLQALKVGAAAAAPAAATAAQGAGLSSRPQRCTQLAHHGSGGSSGAQGGPGARFHVEFASGTCYSLR